MRLLLGALSSLRGRLIGVMILGLSATAIAVVALSHLARTSRDQRTSRAHDRVEAEVLRLSELAPSLPRAQRPRHGRRGGAGELRSGFLDEAGSSDNPLLERMAKQVLDGSEPAIDQSVSADGASTVTAVGRIPGGGFAWATQRVVLGPEVASLRLAVAGLALAMLAMVFASVQTVVAFDRGAAVLRQSASLLAHDLRARVQRPKLKELAAVADGLDGLARDLWRAQEDRVRLMRELAEHERWAALGRVVAGVAHEVRNPLAAIKLRTDLAEVAPDVPATLREDFALIGAEAARLDRLVRDLLLLADRKQSAAARVHTDVASLARARAALLAPWAEGRGVGFDVGGEGAALLDVDAVTRAVDNLLRNAVEASPRGASVRVSVAPSEGFVHVTFSDAGSGVADENSAMVFEPFFTTKSGGTGLGLALSRSVAEAHGGSLRYARVDGETRFTLILGAE